jgi:porin
MARYRLACTSLLALLAATPALAQVAGPPDPQPAPRARLSNLNRTAPNLIPVSGDDDDQATGPLAKVGKTLADDGILFRGLLTNELAGNVTGGVAQGTRNVGQVYLGTDLDLHKILGIRGAKFHFTLYHDYGDPLSKQVTGTFFKQQDIYKNDYTRLHFGLFAYEQSLFHNKVDITLGRLGTTAFFGHLQTNCYFQAGNTCGIPVVLNSEAGFGLLPSATWGGNVKIRPAKHFYIDTGAFEVNPTVADTNGLIVSTSGATGFTIPVEFGYENASFKQTRYPTEIKLGGYLSTADRVDPYYDAKGTSAGLTGTKQRNATTTREGVYLMADRTIWRPDPDSTHSLSVFGGWIQPLEHEEVVDAQVYSGLLLRGPFKSRARDSVGISATYLHISAKEIDFLRDSRIRAGGSGTNNPDEFAFELNYGVGIGRSVRVTPNVQYVVNPDNSALPKITFVPKNIVTFGLKLTVNLATLAGLPSAGPSDD